MFYLFQWIGTAAKWLFGAIVAPLANLRQSKGFGRAMRYIVHGLAVLFMLAGLGWANYYFELDSMLRTPLPLLRFVWLPAMFAIAYSLLWLGWYVCRALLRNTTVSPFADIDQAWQEATDSLRQAGVDVTRTPLYLLVGQPQGSVNDLIRSAGISLITPPVPAAERMPPLQVFANREAIYVSCADVSLLGRQAQLFASASSLASLQGEGPRVNAQADNTPSDGEIELGEIPFDSSADSQGSGGSATTATAQRKETAPPPGLSLVEEKVAMLVADYDTTPAADFDQQFAPSAQLDPLTKDLSAALLTDPDQADLISQRLEYVCQLIREERHPHVPLHGVAVLIPADAGDCDAASHHVGELARRDIETIHTAVETHCPHVAMVCDLEQTPGCDSLLERFPSEQRQRRLGVRLPEPTSNDLHTFGEAIDERMHWLCESLLTPLAYRLVEASSDPNGEQEAIRGNLGLYRFLFRMRQRCDRLSVLLRRMTAIDQSANGAVTGCYLVASGADSTHQQGFAEAVFAHLPQLASSLAWSKSALETDRRQRRLARLGYVGLATLTGLLVLLILTI